MPRSATETLCQEWFRRVWNNLEADAIDQLMTPDCLAHGLGPEPLRGPAGFKPIWESFTAAFRDIRIEVLQEVHEGDLVAAYCSVRLVSKEDGKAHAFVGCPMLRLEGRRMAEAWNVWDFLTLVESRGVVPPNALEAALTRSTR
jgi:ketosteroid isomerase-like protein